MSSWDSVWCLIGSCIKFYMQRSGCWEHSFWSLMTLKSTRRQFHASVWIMLEATLNSLLFTEVSERFSRFLLGLPPGHLCSCNYTFGTWSKLVLWPWNCVMPLQNDLGIMSLDYALTHGPPSAPSCSQHSLWPWNSISDTEDDLVMTLRCCQWPSWPWEVLLSLIAPTWPYALPFYYDYIVNL